MVVQFTLVVLQKPERKTPLSKSLSSSAAGQPVMNEACVSDQYYHQKAWQPHMSCFLCICVCVFVNTHLWFLYIHDYGMAVTFLFFQRCIQIWKRWFHIWLFTNQKEIDFIFDRLSSYEEYDHLNIKRGMIYTLYNILCVYVYIFVCVHCT